MGKLAGDTNVLGVADLLQHLSQNQKEGTVTISSGEQRKVIHLGPGGMRLLKTTSRRSSSLGEILIRTRKITRQQLDQYLEEQRRTGKKLGEIVGKLGLVTKKDIELALREQVEEEIFDLFTWSEATFEFVEGPVPPPEPGGQEPIVVETSAGAIMMEAARRSDEMSMIMKVVRNENMIPMKTTKAIDPASLTESPDLIQGVFSQISGRHSVAEVIRRSLYPRFDALRALFILANKGHIKIFDREGATAVQLRAETTKIKLQQGQATPKPAGSPTPSKGTAQISRKTVLLLGEMLKYRSILAALLREGQYEVIEEVASQALTILTQGRKIDSVILDIGISTENGFQFCAWLAENTTSPIIVLSTDASKDAAERASASGAKAYVVKPFTREVILERLNELLTGRQGTRSIAKAATQRQIPTPGA